MGVEGMGGLGGGPGTLSLAVVVLRTAPRCGGFEGWALVGEEEGLHLLEVMAERSLLPTSLLRSQKSSLPSGETSWLLCQHHTALSLIIWDGQMLHPPSPNQPSLSPLD